MAEPLRLSFSRSAKGSGMTRVERLNLHPTLKKRLLAELKKKLGCGGSIQAGRLEFQGDQREALARELAARGYASRRIG